MGAFVIRPVPHPVHNYHYDDYHPVHNYHYDDYHHAIFCNLPLLHFFIVVRIDVNVIVG